MENNLIVRPGGLPFGPTAAQRAEIIEQLLADLRKRLTAADSFECRASCPVVRQGWERTPCGQVFPQYVRSNCTTYHITITQGPPVAEFEGHP